MPSHPPQEQTSDAHRFLTLGIASASSVVAAIVVSHIWGPGTLIGAAATPVIVTLVGDALRRPAEKISVVRITPSGTRVHERVDPADAPPGAVIAEPDEMGPTTVHRARRRGRRPLVLALVTGLVAFAVGAAVLTGTELVFGDKLGSGGGSTTYFRGAGQSSRTAPSRGTSSSETTTSPRSTPTTTMTTTTTTTIPAPAAPPTDSTPTTPPAQTTTPPADGAAPPTGATAP